MGMMIPNDEGSNTGTRLTMLQVWSKTHDVIYENIFDGYTCIILLIYQHFQTTRPSTSSTVHADNKYRNLVIDLGNGVKSNAQLTYPAVGKGPFSGVLLIHGSGATDKNETAGFVHESGPKPAE